MLTWSVYFLPLLSSFIPIFHDPNNHQAQGQFCFTAACLSHLSFLCSLPCQHCCQQAQGNACLRVACVFCLVAALIFLAVVLAKLYQLFYLLLTDQVLNIWASLSKVRTQKKITVLFGNFSQVADPPLLGTPYSKKKKIIVYFAF